MNQTDNVQFYTSQVDGNNWIYYLDGLTGHILARQQAPKVDFHCNLRFEDSGPAIDIVNDDGSTQEVLAQLYTELKAWATIAASVLGGMLKSKSGAGAGVRPPADSGRPAGRRRRDAGCPPRPIRVSS